MDIKQVVTIAVSAATAVIVKEIISWFIASAKRGAQTEAVRAKARNALSKRNLRTLLLFVASAYTVWSIWARMHETTPITRHTIFFIMLSFYNFVAWSFWFLFDVSDRLYDWWKERAQRKIQMSKQSSASE